MQNLVSKYSENSSEQNSITLNDKKQKSDDYTLKKNLEEIDLKIDATNKKKQQLDTQLAITNMMGGDGFQCQSDLDYQTIYGYELLLNKEQYTMQDKIQNLYTENSDKITGLQKKQLDFDVYKLLWDINTYNKELEYLDALEMQKSHELSVIKNSLKLGYATEYDVLVVEADLESAKADIVSCQNKLDLLKQKYKLNAKSEIIDFTADCSSQNNYDAKIYLDKFKTNSYNSTYYRKQAEIYKEYAENLDALLLQVSIGKPEFLIRFYYVSEENSKYYDRIFQNIIDEKEYYLNEMEIAENNALKYEEQLELYVYELCANMSSFEAQRNANESAVTAAKKQYEISTALFEEGRINKTKLLEAESNVYKLKYELAQIESEIMCNKYKLDNLIEST